MNDELGIHNINESATTQVEVDTKLLSNAIIELNISRKNISLYPIEHSIIRKAIERTYNLLHDIFRMTDEVSIGISKNTLIFKQSYLDKKNPVYKDFAMAMNEKKVASITFKNGISVEELNKFLVVSSLNIDEINKRGGISKAIEQENILHIKVTEIDYEAFQVTSEGEISKQIKKSDSDSTSLWDSFVYKLMDGTLGTSKEYQKEDGEKKKVRVDPAKLAKMISETGNKSGTVGKYRYDKIITEYLKEAHKSDNLNDVEKGTFIKDVANFTNELSPSLRSQFLENTLKSDDLDMETIEGFVSDLSTETILDTLTDINNQKLKIPDTILNLLKKFSSIGKDVKSAATEEPTQKMKADNVENEVLKENINKLMTKDHQHEFTPDVYQESLDKIVASNNVNKLKETYSKEFDEFMNSFSSEIIDLRYVSILIEIFKKEKSLEALKNILNKLFEDSLFFIETGQYESAAAIWAFFISAEQLEEYPKEIKELILSKIGEVKEQKIIDELIDGLKQYGKEKFEYIKSILLTMQEISIKPLLKELNRETNSYYRKLYINIISQMDKKIGAELVRHLNDSKWFFVRNMIVLLRNLKCSEYLNEIKNCCTHENKMVKLEAIKTLLELKDVDAITILKESINDEDKDFSYPCMLLAGSYQATELTPLLLSKLTKSKNVYFESDLKEKKTVVKALGEMGDKKALPQFKDILTTNSFFAQHNLKELKLELLKSLYKFNREDTKELLQICSKSKDEDIVKMCKQLQ